MNRSKENPIGMTLILIAVLALVFAYSCECPAQEVKPTKPPIVAPTPADGSTAEEYYEFILYQPDMESWIETNYDPVETRAGTHIMPKDVIFQSASAGLSVMCTYGYENFYYGDGSGDIRGLWNQGFIGIEGTEVAFRLMDLFISNAWAKSNEWKDVKAIKKLSKLQQKPAKPKKVKWTKDKGLKEKKEKIEKGEK